MLDGVLPVPISKLVFSYDLHHPVEHAEEKILTHRRLGLSLGSGHDTVDVMPELNILIIQKQVIARGYADLTEALT